MSVATIEQRNVCRELMEWCQHRPLPVQRRCITIAFNLTRLADDPDNLKLRRETMIHIASLQTVLRGINDPGLQKLAKAPRTKFQKRSARIEVSGCKPFVVAVWDVSTWGACLLVGPEVDLPTAVKINFDNMVRQAVIVWRRWSFLGVRFTDQLDAHSSEQFELMLKRAADREQSMAGPKLGPMRPSRAPWITRG